MALRGSLMATLKEYFDADFATVISASHKLSVSSPDSAITVECIARVHIDFNSGTKYISYFIPPCSHFLQVCMTLISNLENTFFLTGDVNVQLPPARQVYGKLFVNNSVPVTIKALPPCEGEIDAATLPFSGTVFLYAQQQPRPPELTYLKRQAQQMNINLRFRGQEYVKERVKLETPLAFISHDFRDKEQIARPIALELSKLLCPVWYDEYTLKVGDRLRESIEKGLKECQKCVLILSNHFLTNEGWTKVEFNSIFTREIVERKDFVLPVWCGITKEQLFDYCPTLVDRFGVNWNFGLDEVVRRLHRAIL